MRTTSIAAILIALALPATALAGPDGTYHVKGVNPDEGNDYTGTVKIVRTGEVYSVVWQIGDDETVGTGLGLRMVDGQLVAGPASNDDTGIAISYASGDSFGNATYTEFSDGTWRGVWVGNGDKTTSTEEWVPTVRQIKAKSSVTAETEEMKIRKSDVQPAKIGDVEVEATPARIMTSPIPRQRKPEVLSENVPKNRRTPSVSPLNALREAR